MNEKAQVRVGLVMIVILWSAASGLLFPLVMPTEAASALALIGGMLVGTFVVLSWMRT